MVTIFGIPSFVVTLAGLLGWQGAQLAVLGDTGSVNLPTADHRPHRHLLRPAVGWTLAIAVIAGYAASPARAAPAWSAGLEG